MGATTKRDLARAYEDAVSFRGLFPEACCERWEFAGSVRRGRPAVGDVEHVIVPRWGEVTDPADLFAVPRRANLLWHHLDRLVCEGGGVGRACYGDDGRRRWGEKYRG